MTRSAPGAVHLPAVSEVFADLLRGRRAELNARFADARHRLPALDPSAFGAFLREHVDPLVRAVHEMRPQRATAVALAAFDVALELVGQQLAGPGARRRVIDDVWHRVLPAAARAVADAPQRVMASLSNAAHQIAGTQGARHAEWIEELARLAPRCSDTEELLRIGQIAAWRAGLAHYRQGAIAAAAALPRPLALAAVAASESAEWATIEAGLRGSEWFDPSQPASTAPAVVRIGGFRGFGGPFTQPPHVVIEAGQLHALSGDERWLVMADCFGATFHRVPADGGRPAVPSISLPPAVRLRGDDTLCVGARTVALEPSGEITSVAASATTLALTWSHSHHLTLVALA